MGKDTFNAEVRGLSDGSAVFDLQSRRIPKNDMLCIQRVSITNETSDGTYCTIGVMKGEKAYLFETVTITTKGHFYALTEPIYIVSGTEVLFRFLGTNSNDKLHGFAYGYYLY